MEGLCARGSAAEVERPRLECSPRGGLGGLASAPLLIQGTIQSQKPVWRFFVLVISGAFLLTWIYNNTGGSVLAAMIYHTMNNLSYLIFPTLET